MAKQSNRDRVAQEAKQVKHDPVETSGTDGRERTRMDGETTESQDGDAGDDSAIRRVSAGADNGPSHRAVFDVAEFQHLVVSDLEQRVVNGRAWHIEDSEKAVVAAARKFIRRHTPRRSRGKK